MAIITFTYETTGTPVTLSFSSPSASATIGSAFAEPTLTVSPVAAQSEVVYSSSNTGVATVNASTGVVTLVGGGSTTITAAISGSATYANASASYTLTVTDPTAASVKYSPASGTEFAAGAIDNIKNGDVTVATIKYSESGDGYVSFKFNKGGATYDEIEFNALTEGNGTNGNQPGGTFYTITPNYDGRIQMAVIINNDKIMVVEEDGVAMSGFTKKTEKFYGIESFDVKAGSTYKCYVSGSKMGFYGLVYTYSTAVDITPAYNKSTYVTTKALDFSGVDGLKAYVATAATNGSVTLDEVGAVPAGTPLMLIGTASTKYTVPVAASASAPAVNMLVAGDGTTTFDGTSYDYLLYTDGLFHQISSGSIAVGKAYLHCTTDPKAAVSRTLELNIGGGGATGIEKIKVGTEDNVYYDLQGRRVLYPTKGLYIVNGKKVILK
ncbi:MAG: hypothetical protein IJV17_05710 [Prevotella sp.]|nr:hypothetical protein [Prevotella sp.]